jgi:hypothetical protein
VKSLISARVGRSDSRQLADLALERLKIAFLTRDAGFQLRHPVQIALVVAFVAAPLGIAAGIVA